MKYLTQADFNSAPDWAHWLAVNNDGVAYASSLDNTRYKRFGEDYDPNEWQDSAIKREVSNDE